MLQNLPDIRLPIDEAFVILHEMISCEMEFMIKYPPTSLHSKTAYEGIFNALFSLHEKYMEEFGNLPTPFEIMRGKTLELPADERRPNK